MGNIKRFGALLVLLLVTAFAFVGCEYTSESGEIPRSPVQEMRARIQGQSGVGSQVILQFSLHREFRFGAVETEFTAESWEAYNMALSELALGNAITTDLQNDIVFFARSGEDKITAIRNRYWAGYLNIQKSPDTRDNFVPLAGSNHERLLERSCENQVYENAGGLLPGISVTTEQETPWEVILMIIEDGQVFRYVVKGAGVGATWAS